MEKDILAGKVAKLEAELKAYSSQKESLDLKESVDQKEAVEEVKAKLAVLEAEAKMAKAYERDLEK